MGHIARVGGIHLLAHDKLVLDEDLICNWTNRSANQSLSRVKLDTLLGISTT